MLNPCEQRQCDVAGKMTISRHVINAPKKGIPHSATSRFVGYPPPPDLSGYPPPPPRLLYYKMSPDMCKNYIIRPVESIYSLRVRYRIYYKSDKLYTVFKKFGWAKPPCYGSDNPVQFSTDHK